MSVVFQHGIGGSQDLPISLPSALAGGAAALAVLTGQLPLLVVMVGFTIGELYLLLTV